jgi:hypothetical protein
LSALVRPVQYGTVGRRASRPSPACAFRRCLVILDVLYKYRLRSPLLQGALPGAVVWWVRLDYVRRLDVVRPVPQARAVRDNVRAQQRTLLATID